MKVVNIMLNKLALTIALVLATAPLLAQENTDISGATFQSGGADATLAALGRDAAASGSRLVITAPHEWHAKIAAKVSAGGKANIVLRDGFYETVLVRVQDKEEIRQAAAPSEAERAAQRSRAEVEKAKAEAETAKAEAEKAKAEAEAAKAAAEQASAEAARAKAQADAEAARTREEAARVAAEKERLERERAAAAAQPLVALPAGKAGTRANAGKPAARTNAGKAAESVPALTGDAAVRARMEKSLNDGRSADGELAVDRLKSGDTLYADSGQIAVIRREGGKPIMYWLAGTLDLRRSELKETAPNRYQVLGLIRGEGSLRREFAGQNQVQARLPAANAPARSQFESSLNDGKPFNDSLAPADLRAGDVLYVDGDAVAVAHRDGFALKRYWLVGAVDLNGQGVQMETGNRYRVTRDGLR